MAGKGKRLDVYLICAGKYHDIDFARSEILKLLLEDDRIRTRVGEDYSNIEAIKAADVLITYTCDLIPTEEQQKQLQEHMQNGGRWLALHGTNSILRFLKNGLVSSPRLAPGFMDILGSQFIAHPPLQDFEVKITDPDHPLVKGMKSFITNDEIYVSEFYGDNHVLLHTEWAGEATGFEESDWSKADRHPLMYLRQYGKGQVLYFALGHCRSKYDLQPLVEEYPILERCSWTRPEFYELLRRSIAWVLPPRS